MVGELLVNPLLKITLQGTSGRVFQVSECGETSDLHQQHSGICQGCPVSPFLFIIVMSVVMDIAMQSLSADAQQAAAEHSLYDVVYADDTMILGIRPEHVMELAAAIEKAGAHFWE